MLQSPLVALAFIGLWQVLDILLHVATNQIEYIRITASIVLFAGALAAMKATRPAVFLLSCGLLHLGLNLVFLADRGLTNSTTGALRIPLLGIGIISLAALAWFHRTLKSSKDQ